MPELRARRDALGRTKTGRTLGVSVSATARRQISASACRLVWMYREGTNGRKMSSAEMKTKGEGAAGEEREERDEWNESKSCRAARTA